MKRVENPELKRKLLNHLGALYKIKEIREPNHLSSYIGCRTRTFFDQKQAIEPTDEEVMLFALGYGLQDVLTPKTSTAKIYNYEGIIYRPDMSFEVSKGEIDKLLELKTTRKSAKYHYIEDSVPLTWLTYMQGGCKIVGTDTYDLAVLYMMGNYSPPFPQIYCDTFVFDEEEITANWKIIQANKAVLDSALKHGTPPTPFANCYEWECKFCRYKMLCDTIVQALGLPNKIQENQIKEDMKLWQ
jgi:hypothetical protein